MNTPLAEKSSPPVHNGNYVPMRADYLRNIEQAGPPPEGFRYVQIGEYIPEGSFTLGLYKHEYFPTEEEFVGALVLPSFVPPVICPIA